MTKLTKEQGKRLIKKMLEKENLTKEQLKEFRKILKEDEELGLPLTTEGIIHALEEVCGDHHRCTTKYYPKEKFKDFNEAQDYAVQRDGVCHGLKEFWELSIDHYKDRQLKAIEKKAKQKK